ncbi:glycosyltransferase involved in cell wall biosynthesis [Bradyrhizobium sp. JR1.5]|uniref:glycosyltransferase family 4 protein n=1 Tax=unclassified Bradyrhizobium TaxID=2631580 RepID=UPI00339B6759
MVPTRRDSPQSPIRLGIDASNLRIGGGITHLVELLRESNPAEHGFERIFVWASAATLARVEDRPWVEKRTSAALEASLPRRVSWQRLVLPQELSAAKIDLLFAPGGSIVVKFKPVVTMSRNMLPFEWTELRRFGLSRTALKLALLRWNQGTSFKRADGTIFLTRYAFDAVTKATGSLKGRTAIIPHGVDTRFRMPPRCQRAAAELTAPDPLRVVYVSTVDEYKHQWNVVEAIGRLHAEGLPIRLDLYGSARPSTLPRLTEAIKRVDGERQFVRYWGAVDYSEIHQCYAAADVCVFASSCENMPNILIESMAAGLPIACSDRGPMPEVLGDAGSYFDPEDPVSIADAVRQLALAPQLRADKALAAFEASSQFSWARCARETFDFLSMVAREHQNSSAK